MCDNCSYDLTTQRLSKITAAHIHKGKAGQAGPPVVPLPIHTAGMKGCTSASAGIVQAIAANPSDYYVNVHTLKHPAGAIRGQLGSQ